MLDIICIVVIILLIRKHKRREQFLKLLIKFKKNISGREISEIKKGFPMTESPLKTIIN